MLSTSSSSASSEPKAIIQQKPSSSAKADARLHRSPATARPRPECISGGYADNRWSDWRHTPRGHPHHVIDGESFEPANAGVENPSQFESAGDFPFGRGGEQIELRSRFMRATG